MFWIYVTNLALHRILVLSTVVSVVVSHPNSGLTSYSGSMLLIWLCMPELDDWPQYVTKSLG